MNLYLAGPMSGIKQFNVPAFTDMARRMREAGFDVVNPVEEDSPLTQLEALHSEQGDLADLSETTWGQCLGPAITRVADDVDGIALLKGWQKSRGALLEAIAAWMCDKHFFEVQTLDDKMLLVRMTKRTAYDAIQEGLEGLL